MTDLTPIESRRIVTCQYGPEPHPIDDECNNVTDLTPVDRAPTARPGAYVVVNAAEHPTIDGWVAEQARAEADHSGLLLGDYLGREDVLGERRPPDLCCHVFAASRPGASRD